MVLELRHLRLVHAIADRGTMTQAAVVLHVSQSALSHQLQEVESQLGVRLFHRAGRRMILTPAGERLLSTSRRVLHEVELAESEIAGFKTGQRGTLRISTQCVTAYHWLPSRIRLLGQRLPDVSVEVCVDATADPIRSLVQGHLDIAIVHSFTPDPDLEQFPLFRDEIVAIVSPRVPLARKRFLVARDFVGSHVVMYPVRAESTLLFQKMLIPADVVPAKISKFQLTEAILEMAREGLGIAILPRWSAYPYLRRKELRAVRLSRKGLHREWRAIILKSLHTPPFVREFVHLLARHPITLDGTSPNIGKGLLAVGRTGPPPRCTLPSPDSSTH